MSRVFDVALILHADHELNASTFAGRVVAATLSDIYSAVTAAIGALKGPLHGGANEGVIHMLLSTGSPGRGGRKGAGGPKQQGAEDQDLRLRPSRLSRAGPARDSSEEA